MDSLHSDPRYQATYARYSKRMQRWFLILVAILMVTLLLPTFLPQRWQTPFLWAAGVEIVLLSIVGPLYHRLIRFAVQLRLGLEDNPAQTTSDEDFT